MSTYQIGGLWLTPDGKQVELPDSVAAMLGYQRAPSITSTPFATTSAPTLALRKLPTGTSTGPGDPCAGLKARVLKYGDNDPQPVIRRALLDKCEAQQRAGGVSVSASGPDLGLGEPNEGMDPKVKIAIGVGAALVLGFVGFKVLRG